MDLRPDRRRLASRRLALPSVGDLQLNVNFTVNFLVGSSRTHTRVVEASRTVAADVTIINSSAPPSLIRRAMATGYRYMHEF